MDTQKRGDIVIYRASAGNISIKAKLVGDTIWLSQKEIAELFDVNVPAVSKHLDNIYKSGELELGRTISKMETVRREGTRDVRRTIDFYNLDAVISVGYRVNSKKATDFRVWASRILKDYLTKGYVVDQKRLLENQKQLIEAQKLLLLIGEKSKFELLHGHELELLDLINEYAKSWRVLDDFDADKLEVKKLHKQVRFEISYDGSLELVGQMREQLAKLRVNVYLFGQEIGPKLKAIMGSINQTFDGSDLYKSVEEKAANLLYLVIKDHPFADGNKRIGAMLFVYFLENNDFLYRKSGEAKISDNTLIALALLVATSNPKEKDSLIKLIINLIQS
ncbi:MAG: virulence protein RhuM/Fic/DOC family protein [Candidatus Berkelbacteria bacterium]|nr:virulence protein RhuM/Fic/DOC family protein [Candidatus Berkelbacteria bacterium]